LGGYNQKEKSWWGMWHVSEKSEMLRGFGGKTERKEKTWKT